VPRVTVDDELCVGSADCARTVPGAFLVNEDLGISVPQPGAATADPALLVRAARQCPTNAIRVVADDGDVLYESA
jgi:ferredoxin